MAPSRRLAVNTRARNMSAPLRTVTIDARQFHAFDPGRWTLIPLHRYTDASEHRGRTRKDGKRPLDRDWTQRPYDTRATVARCEAENRNAGVRLPADIVVVDVDLRHGGEH